jgi:hypothetical protein
MVPGMCRVNDDDRRTQRGFQENVGSDVTIYFSVIHQPLCPECS